MIERPATTIEAGELLVEDRRPEDPGARLRFWGLIVLGLAALGPILLPELRGSHGPLGLVIPAAIGVVGAVLIVIAGRPRPGRKVLAKLSSYRGTLHVLEGASTEFPDLDRVIPTAEVEAVVFGMTRFPLEGRTSKVDAFSVCVRLYDESVVPVVEASTEKAAAFGVALQLSEHLSVPLVQTGLGIE